MRRKSNQAELDEVAQRIRKVVGIRRVKLILSPPRNFQELSVDDLLLTRLSVTDVFNSASGES